MVCLNRLFLLGAGLAATFVSTLSAAVPNPNPAIAPVDASLNARGTVSEPVAASVDVDVGDLEKRDRGRMTLQWSARGRIMFLLGTSLRKGLEDVYVEDKGVRGVGKAILNEFQDWLYQNLDKHCAAEKVVRLAKDGGVYAKQGFGTIGDYGFGIICRAGDEVQPVVNAIKEWARQDGGIVEVAERAHNFFSPEQIGACDVPDIDIPRRSMDNKCVKRKESILKYVNHDVPLNLDINKTIRWAGKCDA